MQSVNITRFLGAAASLLLLLIGWPLQAQTPPLVSLSLKPAQCVSLRQGQTCYVDIELSWTADRAADYCLYSSQQQNPLHCWRNATGGHFARELKTTESVTFQILERDTSDVLADAQMKVAWVYKKKRTSVSWRLF